MLKQKRLHVYAGALALLSVIGVTATFYSLFRTPAEAVVGLTLGGMKVFFFLCFLTDDVPPPLRYFGFTIIALIQALVAICTFIVAAYVTSVDALEVGQVFRWAVVGMAVILDPLFMLLIYLVAIDRRAEAR